MDSNEPPAKTGTAKIDREFTVINRNGIHARPAAQIVRTANRFPNVELEVRKGEESVNSKSIMGLMMLAAGNGSRLVFSASGDKASANALLDELGKLFSTGFNEE